MFSKLVSSFKEVIAWGKEVATESSTGVASASRVVALMVSTGVVGVLIAHVCIHRSLPDAPQMYGLSSLVGAASGAYAANKIAGNGNGGNPPPQEPPQGDNSHGTPS